MINFLFADDAPELKALTLSFFNDFVGTHIYDIYISDVVIFEIDKTSNEQKRKELKLVIEKYQFQILRLNEEATQLADIYIDKAIIPAKKKEDALHIAICTVNNFDVLLSWNFKHLANIHKRNQVKITNEQQGYYYPLDLLTPIQLIGDESEDE